MRVKIEKHLKAYLNINIRKMAEFLFINQPRLGEIPAPREIDCSNPQQDFIIQPLGLAYLAAAARNAGKSVELVDASAENIGYEQLDKIIEKIKPKVIIGCFSSPTIIIDMKLGDYAKKHKALFGVWGPTPSALREFLFRKFPNLDFIIENEPEFTMQEIAKNKKRNIFAKIKGVSYRNGKNIVFNGYRKLEKNLDRLPIPAYDLLKMNIYHTPYNRKLPMTLMRSSRGCIASCIFCITGGQSDIYRGYGKPWRAYSAKRTVDEIEEVVKKYNIKEINFFDAEFTIDENRAIDICKEILNRRIKVIWNCNSRADSVNEEILKWMKKAGCYSISFGLESANSKVLEICRKRISPEQVENAIIMTKQAGIKPAVYFMMGLPGENEESIKETIKFAKKIAVKYGLRPQCTIATPYPGTIFYEMAKKNDWIKKDIEFLEQTTASICYPNLSQEQLEYWHEKFYKEVVLNPVRIIKRVLSIRHINEIKSIPIHIKDFVFGFLNKMKYLR